MLLATTLAWATFGLILLFFDPEESLILAPAAILLSLGIASTGTLAILGVVTRVFIFRRHGLISQHVRVSLRQAALVALLMIIALELSHLSLFAWWNMLLAIATFAVAEYFFLSSDADALEAYDIGSDYSND